MCVGFTFRFFDFLNGFWVQAGLGYWRIILKWETNEMDTSFSSWDHNNDKIVILGSLSFRDLENETLQI